MIWSQVVELLHWFLYTTIMCLHWHRRLLRRSYFTRPPLCPTCVILLAITLLPAIISNWLIFGLVYDKVNRIWKRTMAPGVMRLWRRQKQTQHSVNDWHVNCYLAVEWIVSFRLSCHGSVNAHGVTWVTRATTTYFIIVNLTWNCLRLICNVTNLNNYVGIWYYI